MGGARGGGAQGGGVLGGWWQKEMMIRMGIVGRVKGLG